MSHFARGASLWIVGACVLPGCMAAPVVGFSSQADADKCAEVELNCADIDVAPTQAVIPETASVPPARTCATVTERTIGAGELNSLNDLRCVNVTIDLGEGDAAVLDNAFWIGVRARVTSSRARGLVLRRSNAVDSWVEVDGKAWVAIEKSSGLSHVVVTTDADLVGDFLRVDEAVVHDIAIVSGARGHLRVSRSSVEGGVIDVGALTVDESEVRGLNVRADSALFAGATLRQSALWVRELNDVSGTWQHVSTTGTDELAFFETSIADANLEGSVEATTFEHASVAASTLRGPMRFSHTNVNDSLMATGDGNGIETFNTNIADSAFCGSTVLRTSQGSIMCTSCDVAIVERTLLGTVVSSPQCPSLTDGEVPF